MCDNNDGMTRAEYKAYVQERLTEKLEDLAIDLDLPTINPIKAPARGNLCEAFWGREWCRHIQTYAHWEHRLNKGRSLLRKECVYAITIEEGYACAYVATDDLYKVEIRVDSVDEDFKQLLMESTQRNACSLLDLWEGCISEAVMSTLCLGDHSIFPQSNEIRLSCGCLDWADLCEHGGAVLYALGIYFESNPAQLFLWRGLVPDEFFKESSQKGISAYTQIEEIPEGEIASIFGIDVPNN